MKRLIFSFLFAFSIIATTFSNYAYAQNACADLFTEKQRKEFAPAVETVQAVEAFAREHNLPTQIVEVGPHGAKRLLIGLDIANEALMSAYRKRFNLETQVTEQTPGALVLEFQHETPGQYVTGVLRRHADADQPIYRWGRPDLKLKDWWEQWVMGGMAPGRNKPIVGYGHIIGLTKAELENVRFFLENPEQRGPCKSDNCVAWTSNIELGRTAKEAKPEERQPLFSVLGVARSMAHFEISRRLYHASNQRHSAIFVFYQGEAGRVAFTQRVEDHMPILPKIPITTIIRGMEFQNPQLAKAIEQIPDGARIFLPIGAGASPEAVNALVARSMGMQKGVDLHVFVSGVSEATFRRGVKSTDGKFRVKALFLGGNLRSLYRDGDVSVIPGYLRDFPLWMKDKENKEFQYDAVIVRVSPPDAQGRYSLGPNADIVQSLIESQPGIKIIAEVNPNIPRTKGKNFITDAQITAKFESQTELAGPPVVPYTPVEQSIGTNLAGLIQDGSFLQVGIGNVFGGLAEGMKKQQRKDIRIFTEMFSDPLKDLLTEGVATDARTGFAYGSADLYRWLDNNQQVEFVPTIRVNDIAMISRLKKFNAVNTALQVSLLGDVNATFGPDGQRISSPGGQMEFMTGASRSQGGKAIIAIRSTAKNGEISTITLDLYPGPVTTPHENVTHVVTEYGVALLRGKTESERAVALINIAHPKFRKELSQKAKERKLISEKDLASIKFE